MSLRAQRGNLSFLQPGIDNSSSTAEDAGARRGFPTASARHTFHTLLTFPTLQTLLTFRTRGLAAALPPPA
jgi:hypothetical protein